MQEARLMLSGKDRKKGYRTSLWGKYRKLTGRNLKILKKYLYFTRQY